MRLNLLAVSLLALSLSLPVMAADIVINESGTAGAVGPVGEDGSPGGPGGTAPVSVGNTLTGQAGGHGDPGEPGGLGAVGVDGGPVELGTTAPTDGSIVISTNGGTGGTGGKGGLGGYGGDGAFTHSGTGGVSVVGGKGVNGGNAGEGGEGGTGGTGGSIALNVDHDVTGDINLSAIGGAGGEGGVGGRGGKGGKGGLASAIVADAVGGDGGNGGDGAVAGVPGMGGSYSVVNSQGHATVVGTPGTPGAALAGVYHGGVGEAGAGGSITVALNAALGGNLTADAGTGDISVTLNTGASVGGTIAANEAATSALRFAMKVKNTSEYEAAKAYLGDAANALSGSITIGGQTFTWTGFDQLVEALEFVRARAAASEASGPTYLACSPRAVTAFYKDGGIELIARRTAERGAFRIGTVTGNSFNGQNNAGWSVRFDSAGKDVRFDILDRAGDVVATCRG